MINIDLKDFFVCFVEDFLFGLGDLDIFDTHGDCGFCCLCEARVFEIVEELHCSFESYLLVALENEFTHAFFGEAIVLETQLSWDDGVEDHTTWCGLDYFTVAESDFDFFVDVHTTPELLSRTLFVFSEGEGAEALCC